MAATKRCLCDGHWTVRKANWVVTQRGYAINREGQRVESGYCELKCRMCLSKWRTKAQYTVKLPDWEERKYEKLSYEAILELIEADRIRADFESGAVFKEKKTFGHWTGELIRLAVRVQRDNGTSGKVEPNHGYVVLCDQGHRREISVGRLVWMIYHRKVIPAGYDIDHADGDPENNAVTNLVAIESAVNRGDNGHDHDWEEVPF